ncbi:dynamin family protein [Propionicimonas paludicola]|uniref:Dynamin family protein n=1 Tax=Propionicimonas paludicola TaxID=185243 RepID=A0A2A9CR58_9ACTN|nr:ABC transporter [Propionicimonas paludicola]PFG16029.1 dynamin family protein [Propionicimonas paludicola]
MSVESLSAALVRLREALGAVRLPLDLPDAQAVLSRAREQAAQLDDYVLPRLGRLDAPLLAVVGGSTGAGKSTLVNSLIGRPVTAAGVIRPTTRAAVLVHHPDDAAWFTSSQVLPGLARSDGPTQDVRALQLVAEPSLPRGLAVLDAPDLDSVVAENRALAGQLLAAADLWLFVTSAARYADAVPWDYLRSAAERKAVVAVVLDRLPPAAVDDIPAHLGQMMSQRGLAESPLFAVPETEVDADGLLPAAAVAPIRSWLAELAHSAVRRNEVVVQTLDGAITALAAAAPQVAEAVEAQQDAVATLRGDVESIFAMAAESISAQTADGTMLRGEVLARWQDFVGTGEFFRAVEQKIGRMRDRLTAAVKGEPRQAAQLKIAVESGLEILLREEGEAAVRRVVASWQAHPAGRRLLAEHEELGRTLPEFGPAAAQAVRDWQGDVLTLVTSEGQQKKAKARYLALGLNGIGVALMIVVFSQTGGLIGAEVGIAGGTAVLAQRLLEAVFGEDAVRRLARQAKQQLDARTAQVLAPESARFQAVLDQIEVRPGQAEELRAAVAELDRARAEADRFTSAPVPKAPAIPVPTELAALAAEVTRRPQPQPAERDEESTPVEEVEHS